MTAPNWIISLFETLGLKSSEVKLLQREIAASEENIHSLNKEAEKLMDEIKELELRSREAKAEYDILQGVARETASIRLKNLLKQRERMSERNALLNHQLNAETLVHNNLKLQLEHLNSRSADDLKDIQENKEELIALEKENADAIAKLDNTSLSETTASKNNSASHDDFDFDAAIKTFN